MPQYINTTVITPEGVLYEGQTIAVTSFNESGEFAILPLHANFITIIKEKIILHETKHEAKEISIAGGVLSNKNNTVEIFAGISATTKPQTKPA